jgi:hypothetical protein
MTRRRAAMSAIATEMFASEVNEVADAVLHHGTLGFLAHRGLVIVPDTLIAECAEELRCTGTRPHPKPALGCSPRW